MLNVTWHLESIAASGSVAKRLALWFAAGVVLLFIPQTSAWAQSGTWLPNAAGTWNVAGNWVGGTIANGVDNTATFDVNAAIGGIRTITLDAPRTLGHLAFNDRDASDANYWNITSSTLTLQTTTGTPTITLVGTGSGTNWEKDARVTAVIAGNQGLTFIYTPSTATQTPRFELYGNNTYTGITDITGGIIQTGHGNALGVGGTLADRTIIRSGARLHVESGTYSEIIQLDGGTLSDPVNHNPSLTGLVYLTAPSVVNKQGGGTMTFNPSSGNAIELGSNTLTFTGATNPVTTVGVNVLGAITGTGAVVLDSSRTGVISFGGQNTYSGGTTLNGGILRVAAVENAGVSGPLGASGTISFAGGTLQYSATNQFDYSSRFSTAAGQAYRVDLNSQNVTWASNLTSGGASSLSVLGAGGALTSSALTLTGTNTIGTGGITVGLNPSASGDLNGSLLISSGSTSTTGALTVGQGANARGLVRVTGGALSAASANLTSNGSTGSNAALRQSAGQVSVAGTITAFEGRPLIAVSGGTFQYGTLSLSATSGGMSVFDISGGSVTGGQTNIGAANARAGRLTVRGGTFTASGMTLGSSTTNSFGNLVVSETGAVNLGTATLNLGGGNGTTGFGTANLVGGTLSAGRIAKTGTGTTTANLTFSGGTLRATQDSTTFIQGLTSANIYVGGATIDTQNFNLTLAQALSGNTGNGLVTIPVATGGSGYLAPPIITITGGGGSGATAVANLDQTGAVQSITVTNPGINYTSGTLTYTIDNTGTQGSGFTAGNATLGDNTTGSLTKLGTGSLTLSGDNTYSGSTNVSQGTLALANANNNNIAASPLITLASGAFLNTSNLAGTSDLILASGQTLTGTGTVIGNLTVAAGATLKPGNSPGTLNQIGLQVWSPGGDFDFQINDAAGSAGSDPGWGLMSITGSLDVAALSSGMEFEILLSSLDLTNNPGNAVNFDPALDYAWLFVDATDSIVGYTGSNQFLVTATAFANAYSGTFSIVRGDEVSGGDNTQLYVQYLTDLTLVPEPQSIVAWGAVAFLLAGAGWITRRQIEIAGRRHE